jgi:hypothetical protein
MKKSTLQEATSHEQWEIKHVNGIPEKVRLIRAGIKITPAEAIALNSGVNPTDITSTTMYFPASI